MIGLHRLLPAKIENKINITIKSTLTHKLVEFQVRLKLPREVSEYLKKQSKTQASRNPTKSNMY